jgi:hypothetical protein
MHSPQALVGLGAPGWVSAIVMIASIACVDVEKNIKKSHTAHTATERARKLIWEI